MYTDFNTVCLSLTPADSVETGHVVSIVTLQTLVMVTGSSRVTVVVELSGAHLTASTPIRYSAHARRAHGTLRRALAHAGTPRFHLLTSDRRIVIEPFPCPVSISSL